MRIKYSPQRSDDTIAYSFDGEKITATFDGQSDTFDFSGFGDGVAVVDEIVTTLPINPIVSAERVNGELRVILLNYIGADATEAERYPDWQEVS